MKFILMLFMMVVLTSHLYSDQTNVTLYPGTNLVETHNSITNWWTTYSGRAIQFTTANDIDIMYNGVYKMTIISFYVPSGKRSYVGNINSSKKLLNKKSSLKLRIDKFPYNYEQKEN